MGIGPFRSSSFGSSPARWPQGTDPNPKPDKFIIMDRKVVGTCTVLLVSYPGCTTYGGRKLLLYTQIIDPTKWKELDPHFLEDKLSPFARFEPTIKGRAAAMILAKELSR